MNIWECLDKNPGTFLMLGTIFIICTSGFLCKILQVYSQAQANRCNVQVEEARNKKNGQEKAARKD